MSKPLDPMATPATWRAYLYEQILLPWETKTIQCRADVYSRTFIESTLGMLVFKEDKLNELQILEGKLKKQQGEYLAFYCDGRGYEVLFKRLRDTVAHAHYTQRHHGWITLTHRFQGRGERKPKVRLFGHMKMATLKQLATFIDIGRAA